MVILQSEVQFLNAEMPMEETVSGMVRALRLWQSAKALDPMVLRCLGSSICSLKSKFAQITDGVGKDDLLQIRVLPEGVILYGGNRWRQHDAIRVDAAVLQKSVFDG